MNSQAMSPGITAIVLTFNEEQHIARCLASLRPVASRICVIDSFSTDRTLEIATALGADIYQNAWKNYSTQFQWGVDRAGIVTEWTMRIDADEYLEPALQNNILQFLESRSTVNAAYFRRKMIFLGRPIKHGFFYPAHMLRLWRTGQGRIEQRWMDEHVLVENARTIILGGDLVDENLNSLSWWTAKHVGYATREVYDIVNTREQRSESMAGPLSGQARRKRFLKEKVYARLPPALRSTLYFFYRYVIGLGFLDGTAGFFFHFLQAFWYRTLVDAKLYDLEREAARLGITAYELLGRQGVWDMADG
jgi:glycosyltransferase involved in cell wall biosynthesis